MSMDRLQALSSVDLDAAVGGAEISARVGNSGENSDRRSDYLWGGSRERVRSDRMYTLDRAMQACETKHPNSWSNTFGFSQNTAREQCIDAAITKYGG